MLTLEVFLTCHCLSAPRAKSLAQKAVARVGGINLTFRDEVADAAQARKMGLILFPAFVMEDEILTVGIPSLAQLVKMLEEKVTKTRDA